MRTETHHRRMELKCKVCGCPVNMIGRNGWMDKRFRDVFDCDSIVLCEIHDTGMVNETTLFLDEKMKEATGLQVGQAVRLLIDDKKEKQKASYYLNKKIKKFYKNLIKVVSFQGLLHIVRI